MTEEILPSQHADFNTLKDEIAYLRGKLKNQDGKLYLMTAQVQKFQVQKMEVERELGHVKDEVHFKTNENLTLRENLNSYKFQLRSAHGKIQLLQYRLAKIKPNHLEYSYSQSFSHFISHYIRFTSVLRDIEAKSKTPHIPGITASTKQFGVKFIDPFPDQTNDSYSASRLIHQESVLSDDVTKLDLSSYSLNTTVQQSFRQQDRLDPLSARTPDLNESRKNGRKARNAIPIKNSFREILKANLDENVFNTETQRNLRELKQTVNAEGFSIFTSPSSFRENISRIRTENEKLRNDIYRFRGKLEVGVLIISLDMFIIKLV